MMGGNIEKCDTVEVSRSSLPCPWLTFARRDTSNTPRGHKDGGGDEARYDEGHGDAVRGVGDEDSDAEDGHHVEDRPDGDGEPGHGDQGHPDREDSGEHIRPAEEADRGKTHRVHLFCACVIQTRGYQMRCEHDTLSVVTSVGGEHDGGQHGQVTGGQQQTRDEELKLSLERDSRSNLLQQSSPGNLTRRGWGHYRLDPCDPPHRSRQSRTHLSPR